MGLLTLCCLLLAAVLPHCAGEDGVLISLGDDAKKECVDMHNDLRRSEDASDMKRMVWNEEAQKTAENWAQQCIWDHSKDSARRISTCGCGENLYMRTAPFKMPLAIQAWYDEKKDFTYGKGATPSDAMIGHYTQVVWSNSSQLGCAMAKCSSFYIAVCHYCPAGNVQQMVRPYAEGLACSKCPDHCEKNLCTNACLYENNYSNCPSLGCGRYAEDCPATCKCK